MSDKNGWISIDDALFPLAKYTGDEIVIRTKANNGRWVYQIAIVDEDGKVVIDPCVMCSQCGGTLQWKPHAWNPLSKMPMEWKPLGKFIDADRSAAHAKANAEAMYQRALKVEELLYRFYIDRDKKAEEAVLKFVQDGLDKEVSMFEVIHGGNSIPPKVWLKATDIAAEYARCGVSEELKPCPFCGSTDLSADPEDMLIISCVVCNKCGATGPYRDNPQEAIALWNNRPD